MHKVDRTIRDAIGIYDASCEAAGAPICRAARLAAVQKALASQVSPEDVALRLMDLVEPPAHWSDCATHNEPALPRGDCDCGVDAPKPAKRARKPRAPKKAAA